MNRLKARELRKNLTDAERALWKHIRFRQLGGHKFRRQQPIDNYIVDFVCLEKRLIVEIDGGHHSEELVRDAKRGEWLKKQGFGILRFWNNEILKEIEAVKEKILRVLDLCSDPHPYPPPQGGRTFPIQISKPIPMVIFDEKSL